MKSSLTFWFIFNYAFFVLSQNVLPRFLRALYAASLERRGTPVGVGWNLRRLCRRRLTREIAIEP